MGHSCTYKNSLSASVSYMFYLKDHLGSVRAVVSQMGAVQQTNEYYPFGDLFPTSGTDNSGNRFRFTGKELGAETGLYDFSARFLHPRFGRFTILDPLAEKYPSVSPYAYCKCNPVNFVDPDGRNFSRIIRRNTITIEASYYVENHDAISYASASRAVAFWNNRQDIYIAPSGKKYTVDYKLRVFKTDNLSEFESTNNIYRVVDAFDSSTRAGETENNHKIKVLDTYAINRPNSNIPSTTGAHEIGHTLGMKDSEKGIMSESQNELRTDDVTQENLQQMITFPSAYEDWLSKFFPIK